MLSSKYDNKAALLSFLRHSLSIHANDNLVFCTLRFNNPQKDIEQAKQTTRKIYSRILNQFQGRRWYKHPLPSVSIIEHGKTNTLHAHTIFNLGQKTMTDFSTALFFCKHKYPYLYLDYDIFSDLFQKTNNYTPVKNHILVRSVFNMDVLGYMTKEYNFNRRYIDFENLYTSDMLFNAV